MRATDESIVFYKRSKSAKSAKISKQKLSNVEKEIMDRLVEIRKEKENIKQLGAHDYI